MRIRRVFRAFVPLLPLQIFLSALWSFLLHPTILIIYCHQLSGTPAARTAPGLTQSCLRNFPGQTCSLSSVSFSAASPLPSSHTSYTPSSSRTSCLENRLKSVSEYERPSCLYPSHHRLSPSFFQRGLFHRNVRVPSLDIGKQAVPNLGNSVGALPLSSWRVSAVLGGSTKISCRHTNDNRCAHTIRSTFCQGGVRKEEGQSKESETVSMRDRVSSNPLVACVSRVSSLCSSSGWFSFHRVPLTCRRNSSSSLSSHSLPIIRERPITERIPYSGSSQTLFKRSSYPRVLPSSTDVTYIPIVSQAPVPCSSSPSSDSSTTLNCASYKERRRSLFSLREGCMTASTTSRPHCLFLPSAPLSGYDRRDLIVLSSTYKQKPLTGGRASGPSPWRNYRSAPLNCGGISLTHGRCYSPIRRHASVDSCPVTLSQTSMSTSVPSTVSPPAECPSAAASTATVREQTEVQETQQTERERSVERRLQEQQPPAADVSLSFEMEGEIERQLGQLKYLSTPVPSVIDSVLKDREGVRRGLKGLVKSSDVKGMDGMKRKSFLRRVGLQGSMWSVVKSAALIAMWYGLNCQFNIDNKKALNLLPLPFTISALQSLVGIPLSVGPWLLNFRQFPTVYPKPLRRHRQHRMLPPPSPGDLKEEDNNDGDSRDTLSTTSSNTPSVSGDTFDSASLSSEFRVYCRQRLFPLLRGWFPFVEQGFWHTVLHISAMKALSAGAVSFVSIVKAAEPVLTAGLGGLLIGKWLPPETYLSLLPIIMGVGLASLKELSFSWTAFGGSMLSNLGSSMRGLRSKRTLTKRNIVGEHLTPQNIFALTSIMSTLMELPLVAIEASKWREAWQVYMNNMRLLTQQEQLLSSSLSTLTSASSSISQSMPDTASPGTVAPPVFPLSTSASSRWLSNLNPSLSVVLAGLMGKGELRVVKNIVSSGIFYYLYNVVAMKALSGLHPVTHAVVNTLKRVTVILVSSIVFKNRFTPLGVLGSVIAVAGTFGYSVSKKGGGEEDKQRDGGQAADEKEEKKQ
eukprot:GHVQ01007810.1.p1 GENE.GHVQ01007810.1~~GHVQ01007810.1.p1  ORF type:complete len:1023 (+),score=185.35 GHVQ01007810.1:892-3960(+)